MTPQQALDEARTRLGPNGQTRIRISCGKISYVVGLRDGLAFRVLGSGASYDEALASLTPALAPVSVSSSIPETAIPQESTVQAPRCRPRQRPRAPGTPGKEGG